jgi:hypothetical protein
MAVEARIRELDQRHRDLDAVIRQTERSPAADPHEIAALKRRKLRLKEEIEQLRGRVS